MNDRHQRTIDPDVCLHWMDCPNCGEDILPNCRAEKITCGRCGGTFNVELDETEPDDSILRLWEAAA